MIEDLQTVNNPEAQNAQDELEKDWKESRKLFAHFSPGLPFFKIVRA